MRPELTIVIPTKDRPQLLRRAVTSALAQDLSRDVEVVVVDDGSERPVELPSDPQLQVLRLPSSVGGAAARNAGMDVAAGRCIAYLDDDDELYPHYATVSLEALAASRLPGPVGVLSGLEAVDPAGGVLEVKLPQGAARGTWYALDDAEPGRSFHAKQTLVVETGVLRSVGGWNPSFRSRVHTELFLRLSRACSLETIDDVTYRLLVHPGPRVSKDPDLRQRSFEQLLRTHADAFAARPTGSARMHLDHAEQTRRDGRPRSALSAAGVALRLAPRYAARELAGRARRRLRTRTHG